MTKLQYLCYWDIISMILKQGPLLIFFFLNYDCFLNYHVLYRICKLCHRPFPASKRSRFEQKFLGATEPSEPLRGFRTRRYTHSVASDTIFFLSRCLKKENNEEQYVRSFFILNSFKFQYQLRFPFHDSSAKQDGSPPPAWFAQQSLAASERDFMLKCHSVCQGDTCTGGVLFWGTRSGISEYWRYLRLRACKGAYLSAPSA